MGELTFKYRFVLPDEKEREFEVVLDEATLDLKQEEPEIKPDWAKLGFHQCPHCTLEESTSPYCPVALALFKPVVIFKDFLSHEGAVVYITTPERGYQKQSQLQAGLGSLVGLYMVTSGCPIMSWLRPMARFHLPFASEDETLYRAMGMYLTAQYLREKKGLTPDWEMHGLEKIYDDVMTLNKTFLQRLRNTPVKDASINAIIALDCFAMNVKFTLEGEPMTDMRKLFKQYLD